MKKAIQDVTELGCERLLTSGLASSAVDGVEVLAEIVKLADWYKIVAGVGITADNAHYIIEKIGSDDVDDVVVPITDTKKVSAVKQELTIFINNNSQ